MSDKTKLEDIKITTLRPEGQKREYSNYVEISANPRDVSLKFCDLKPPAKREEIDEIMQSGISIFVNTEIVLPFDVAESVLDALQKQIDVVKQAVAKEEK